MSKKARILQKKKPVVKEVKQSWLQSHKWDILLIGLALLISSIFRLILPHAMVFWGGGVTFTSVDCYYHMRVVDAIIVNWPHIPVWDNYVSFPSGQALTMPIVFNYIIALIAMMLGGGSPTQQLADSVGAYTPAVMGILCVIPVYVISQSIFNKRLISGIAVLMVAFLPGEWLGRTLLGATDYHALEMLLSCYALMCVFIALKQPSFNRKAITWSIVAGIISAIYFIAWSGALMLFFILAVYGILDILVAKIRKVESPRHRIEALLTVMVVALMLYAITYPQLMSVIPVIGTIALLAVAYAADRFLKVKWYVIFGGLVAITGAGFGIAHLIAPYYTDVVISTLKGMVIWHTESYTSEEMPLFNTLGKFTMDVSWNYFGIAFYASVIGIGMLTYWAIKKEHSGPRLLLLIWTVLMLLFTLAMRRFAYYYAVNVAIVSAYVGCVIIDSVALRKQVYDKFKMGVATIAIILVLVLPSVRISVDMASHRPRNMITTGWLEAMQWLRYQTEDVAGDEYYNMSGDTRLPSNATGVLSWWDYGYWIVREAHRPTICDPGGGDRNFAAWIFTHKEGELDEGMFKVNNAGQKRLIGGDVKYIVIDYQMALTKYYAMVMHAYQQQETYQQRYEVCFDKSTGKYQPQTLFYLDYYKSLAIRLYNFNGEAVQSPGCPVFIYSDHDGFRELLQIRDFPTYDDAVNYMKSVPQYTCVIAGTDPFLSPISMDKLDDYKLVFQSQTKVSLSGLTEVPMQTDNGLIPLQMPEVKIFEYVGNSSD